MKGFRLSTFVDAPAGSGLERQYISCSHYRGLCRNAETTTGQYDMAHYAYEIERNDLQLAGGRQDQYAAAFGIPNFGILCQ